LNPAFAGIVGRGVAWPLAAAQLVGQLSNNPKIKALYPATACTRRILWKGKSFKACLLAAAQLIGQLINNP